MVEPLPRELGQLSDAFTAGTDPVGDPVQVESSGGALDRLADLACERPELLEVIALRIFLAHNLDGATPVQARAALLEMWRGKHWIEEDE
jgi:hypothetical protein